MAVVVPIYKKGDLNNPSNFRPIALLPIFSKVIEKVLFLQLSRYFESKKLFTGNQFGYRKSLSTVDAVLKLQNYITSCLETEETAIVTFLDLSKAFDCVSHSILLKKLSAYNIDEESCKLLKSYLENRQQLVKFNKTFSDHLPINQGVPQGSILGPLLFLIFVNDLPTNLNSDSVLYADDTTLLNKLISDVAPDMVSAEAQSEAFDWFTANNLVLNVDKSTTMIFTLKKVEIPPSFQSNTNFLGFSLDSKLSWVSHGENTAKKISKNIFLLRHLKENLPREYLRNIYFELFQT